MRDSVDYTNYAGKRGKRAILPHHIWFGESEHHKDGKKWFLCATYLARDVIRDFALKDIHSWRPIKDSGSLSSSR